ncbi:FKBP-type peptidyl-prolyl cis-trans isomerase (rotamase) [Fulvivirga imtechensis AK7]|uniref:Peptidyl-prolyl cis-trans isomerase n=1 Tax=Fulvivirga imtechensis AK7 TaxID=1237149 RepID=L8JPN2_9BACT|nr:FKBP-type peptidyl-prolyl cis-trans isomerase [Fulvivirga imtechensis]ELR70921.1 FKBP-type peptidyl-prolyl cis-trans isomerase (rotamase) [Fulvivirga imtechensis AK7]
MKTIKQLLLVIALGSVFFLLGCNSDDNAFNEQDQYFKELKDIDAYLSENGIQANTDEQTGIRYVIEDQGEGLMPYILDSVTISYTEKLLANGTVVGSESSVKRSWGSLIAGIQLPLLKIQEGGTATAYVPSFYAYGQGGTGNVPANATLIIEVELVEIHSRQLKKDIAIIDDSLDAWGITATKHPSGIRYILDQGSGDSPKYENNVTVNYHGRLLGSKVNFDSGTNKTFSLRGLIGGWQVILPLVKEGGSVTMYLPSPFGYGKTGSGQSIPPNSNLMFEVDLIEVK